MTNQKEKIKEMQKVHAKVKADMAKLKNQLLDAYKKHNEEADKEEDESSNVLKGNSMFSAEGNGEAGADGLVRMILLQRQLLLEGQRKKQGEQQEKEKQDQEKKSFFSWPALLTTPEEDCDPLLEGLARMEEFGAACRFSDKLSRETFL